MIWISTGKLIQKLVKEAGYTQARAARTMSYSEKHFSQIVNGTVAASEPFLTALCEKVLPTYTPSYFLEHDRAYKKHVQEENERVSSGNYHEWDERFSLGKIFKNKEVGQADQVAMVQRALGIQNIEQYQSVFALSNQSAFLLDSSKYGLVNQDTLDVFFALLVYQRSLRLGSLLDYAGNDTLYSNLLRFKPFLTSENTDEIIDALLLICERAGINLLLSKNIPSTYLRGAVFVNDNHIYLLLTERYRTLEFFVFSFVHECMHLLHGDITPGGQSTLLETDNRISSELDEERINGLAREYFIDERLYKDAIRNAHDIAVLSEIAERSDTTVGMIASFLKHDHVVPYAALSQFSHRLWFSQNNPHILW